MAAQKLKETAPVDLSYDSDDSDATLAAEGNQDIVCEIIDLTDTTDDDEDDDVVETGSRQFGIDTDDTPEHEKAQNLLELAEKIKRLSRMAASKVIVIGGILPESVRGTDVFFGDYMPITAYATERKNIVLKAHNVTVDGQLAPTIVLRQNEQQPPWRDHKSWKLREDEVFQHDDIRTGTVVLWGMFNGANKNGLKRHILKWAVLDKQPNGRRQTDNRPVDMEKVNNIAARKVAEKAAAKGQSNAEPSSSKKREPGDRSGAGSSGAGSSKGMAIEL